MTANRKIAKYTCVLVATLLCASSAFAQEAGESAEQEEHQKIGLNFTFGAGAGVVREDHLGSNGYLNLTGRFEAKIKYGLTVGMRYRGLYYKKGYISQNPAFDGSGNQTVTLNEKFQDAQIFLAFNTLFKKTDVVALNIELAPRYASFFNRSFSSWAGGILLGASIVYRPSNSFHLFTGGDWSMRAFGSAPSLSLMGNPKTFWDATAGVGFDFDSDNKKTSWSVDFGWRGDWIAFERNTRNYQTAFAGLTMGI